MPGPTEVEQAAYKLFCEARSVSSARGCELLGREWYRRAGEMGLYGAGFPPALGGSGDRRDALKVMESLGAALLPGFAYWVHSHIACGLLIAIDDPSINVNVLEPARLGETIGCICLTESRGSDLLNPKTVLVSDGAGYTMKGRKQFVSLGNLADFLIVSARQPDGSVSLALVDDRLHQLRREPVVNEFAMRELDMATVYFDHVELPKSAVLRVDPTLALLKVLTLERFICSVVAHRSMTVVCNLIASELEHSVSDAPRLVEFQALRMAAAQIMVRHGFLEQGLLSQKQRYCSGARLDPGWIAGCKFESTSALLAATSFLVELQAARGVTGSAPALKLLNDAYAQSVYGGTTNVMLELLFRQSRAGSSGM